MVARMERRSQTYESSYLFSLQKEQIRYVYIFKGRQNARKGKELFTLKPDAEKTPNGYNVTKNKFLVKT